MSFEIGGVEVFSLDEISKKLGVEADKLKRSIRRGDLVARKVGDQFFVTSQNLLAFLQTPAVPAKKPPKPSSKAPSEPRIVESEPVETASPAAPPAPAPRPVPTEGAEPGDSLQALFDMPILPPEIEIPKTELSPEDKRRQAVEAVKRRSGGKGDTAPIPGGPEMGAKPRRSLLDSEELPTPQMSDMPGSSRPTDTRTSIRAGVAPELPRSAPPPPPPPLPRVVEPLNSPSGVEVPRLSTIPDMFGPDAPTLVLRPELSETKEEGHKESLADMVEHARMARRERDRVITRIRKLPMDAQAKELAGAAGDELVKLDRVVEAGEHAAKELGLPGLPPLEPESAPAPAVVEPAPPPAVEARPPITRAAFEEVPVAPEARAEKEPPPPEETAQEVLVPPVEPSKELDSKWVPAGAPVVPPPAPVPEAFGLIGPQTPEPGAPAPGVPQPGGESWSEVGMPSASAGKSGLDFQMQRGDMKKVERVTLTLTDEERRLLSDNGIAEAAAIHEIMEKFQPTNEKTWEYAKHRYFQPFRMKSVSW